MAACCLLLVCKSSSIVTWARGRCMDHESKHTYYGSFQEAYDLCTCRCHPALSPLFSTPKFPGLSAEFLCHLFCEIFLNTFATVMDASLLFSLPTPSPPLPTLSFPLPLSWKASSVGGTISVHILSVSSPGSTKLHEGKPDCFVPCHAPMCL